MPKAPLVLLPGLLCDDYLWHRQVADLKDCANPIVADLTRDDFVSAMAARALASAPPRFALAGLSMGGYVAFEIIRQAPQRVTRLALLDTSAAPDTAEQSVRRKAGIASLRAGRFAGVTTRLLPRLIHQHHLGGPVGDAIQAMAARVGGEAFLRQQVAIMGRPDSRPLLATIAVPTLVGVGDFDVLTPVGEALDLYRGIDNSTFHVFKFCGHLPAVEKPDETSHVLRQWLAD